MSVEVNYKGAQLGNLVGEHTLNTAGKYMEADVGLNAVYNYFGDNPVLIKTLPTETILLEDTTYPTWTPSTTATTIVPTSNAGTFTATDLANYVYIQRWVTDATVKYVDGATMKAVPLRHISEMIQAIFRRAGNMSYIESGGISYNVVQTWFTAAMLEYDSTSGARGLYIGSYGFYPNLTAPTFSSTSSVSPTVTIKYPTWMARCNSSYFATARAPEVAQHETTLKRKLEVYRVERSIICNALYDNFTDIYNNPL